MLATVSLVLGILLAVILLSRPRRQEPEPDVPSMSPTPLGWWTLALGLIAAVSFALAALLSSSGNMPSLFLWNISIALAFAAVFVGIGTLMRRDRHWPTWLGLLAGLAPGIFWIAFALGNLLGFGE